MKLILLLAATLLISCTSQKSLVEDPIVYIKTSAEPPEDCKELGVVTGVTIKNLGVGEAYKSSLKDIRKSANQLGADYLYLKRMSSDSKFISGIAYLCKS